MVELNTWAGLEPAVMDIKTVSGLAQVFELTLTDSAGSVVDLEGVTFRGAVNTAPLRELMCSVEGGKVLFGWSGLPAGRHSFDLFLVTGQVEKALVRGAFVVSGRVIPPLDQESYSVNHAATLVLPDTTDGIILVDLSEVGLVDLLSRKAGAFAEEARDHVSSVRELKEFIVQKVDGFGYVVDTATTAITEAGKSAVASVESGREEAVQAVKKAGETATTAITEAGKSAVASVESGREEAVQAVKKAKETATAAITEAEKSAVASVESTRRAAVGTITPLVQDVETAKDNIDQVERRINTAATNATTAATSAANSATAAQQALEAMPQVDASGNMTLAGSITAAEGTFDAVVNANGGINIPLAVGAVTDTSAVNRLYAAGMAAVTDAFSVRCYPLPANCSSSNGTVFKTDKEPNSLYFNVPPNSSFTVKCGLVTNARPMHNYSSIRGWVAPVRLPAVSTKFTARFGQMTTVARMGRDRDAFTLVPDQAAGRYRIGEIIDITFDHVRDADAGGYHIRVREIYYSNAEQKWKMKTTQALAPETSSNNGYPVCVYAVVYEQYQDGGYDTEDRGALWLLHGGNSSRGCVKIATVKGVHCFESIYPFSGYYLDMENTNSWALAGAFLPATMHLHCNNVNPAYYGFSSMESNIIVSEAVEDFVDPEAETTTED
ncbi:hypothetical protein [Akkermansia muciniphila]|uniref:hypothetical protein n=1 Tax=Akkermansia muciniphila TaxID=239935 RepID=UPI0011AF4808|nr:hypothetical protein [Akkermansia muciniphila]